MTDDLLQELVARAYETLRTPHGIPVAPEWDDLTEDDRSAWVAFVRHVTARIRAEDQP